MGLPYTENDWMIIHHNGTDMLRGPISADRILEKITELRKSCADNVGVYIVKELRLVLLADALTAQEVESLCKENK